MLIDPTSMERAVRKLWKADNGAGAAGSPPDPKTSPEGSSTPENSGDGGNSDGDGDSDDDGDGGDDPNKVPGSWTEIFNHPRFKQLNNRAKVAEAELQKIRDAEQNNQKQELEKTQQYKKLYEDSQIELNKLKGEIEQKDAAIREQNIRSLVLEAARNAEFADPQDAFSFVSVEDIEVDDDGVADPKTIKKIVDKLAKDKPYLIKKKSPNDPGVPPVNGANPPSDEKLKTASTRQGSSLKRTF